MANVSLAFTGGIKTRMPRYTTVIDVSVDFTEILEGVPQMLALTGE